MTENIIPPVYAGIIDDIGRRQYSGNITWLREYIQNAIDSGTPSIDIKLHGNDLEIIDFGRGMDNDILVREAFGIGKSFKDESKIGELGIGMYAGSGICDTILVRTKMSGRKTYLATVDMIKYRSILTNSRDATFEQAMQQILKIEEASADSDETSFTHIRFEGLSRDAIQLIQKENLVRFLEYTVNLPISDTFQFKEQLNEFLGDTAREIAINLDLNGVSKKIVKFENRSLQLADTFWSHDIRDDEGKLIGKVWAAYNKSGESFPDSRILVKRKGLTVGTEKVVEAEFKAKYSPRYIGEIILLDERIEINTSRDWFVASNYLDTFVIKTRSLLNELWGIADFDSKLGIGIIKLTVTNERLNKRASSNKKRGKIGLAVEENEKIQTNEGKIIEKIEKALEFKTKVDQGQVDLKDPTNKLKNELVERTLNYPRVSEFIKSQKIQPSERQPKKERKNAWPKIVITFLKENIIDDKLAERIGNGDTKDITNRTFTFIEQKIKQLLDKKEQENFDLNKYLSEFKSKYNPPDLRGFSIEKYYQAFTEILEGTFTIFRNPSAHTFMDDMNNPRNLLEIILISDFIVHWLDQWTKK